LKALSTVYLLIYCFAEEFWYCWGKKAHHLQAFLVSKGGNMNIGYWGYCLSWLRWSDTETSPGRTTYRYFYTRDCLGEWEQSWKLCGFN